MFTSWSALKISTQLVTQILEGCREVPGSFGALVEVALGALLGWR